MRIYAIRSLCWPRTSSPLSCAVRAPAWCHLSGSDKLLEFECPVEAMAKSNTASTAQASSAAFLELCSALDAASAFTGSREPKHAKKDEPEEAPSKEEPVEEWPEMPEAAPKHDPYEEWPEFPDEPPKNEMTEMLQMKAETCEHPWAVRPNKRGKSTDLTEAERKRLRHESDASKKANIPWEERGPAQDWEAMAAAKEEAKASGAPMPSNRATVPFWRGQPFRNGHYGGKMRYAKRGGKNQEYYSKLNKAGLLQPTAKGAVRLETPRW